MTDLKLEARVLVCDLERAVLHELPQIFHERFGEGELQPATHSNLVDRASKFNVGEVEFTVVDRIEEVVELMKVAQHPYYSLIIYDSDVVKNTNGSAGMIAYIAKRDFFMPQMFVGSGIDASLAGHCSRACSPGPIYFAGSTAEVRDWVKKIFRKGHKLPNLTVVKMGGSAFDYDRQYKTSLNLEYACQILEKIHKERVGSIKSGNRKVNRIIGMVGSGQYGEIPKDNLRKYGHNYRVVERYPQSMAEAIQANLKSVSLHFGDDAVAVLSTGAFYYIGDSSTSQSIPLIGTAPHYVMVRDQIPLQDSDTGAIAEAEFHCAERVVVIKRTDGVYDFDPYRGFILDFSKERCADLLRWQESQKGNKRHSVVTVDQLLKGGISREGTGLYGVADGSSGHLMEDSALRYMKGCQYVKEVLIVHIAPEEMHYQIGNNEYRHVVTGDKISVDPQIGWKGILEQNIRDAFKGVALSKIVRGN